MKNKLSLSLLLAAVLTVGIVAPVFADHHEGDKHDEHAEGEHKDGEHKDGEHKH